MNRAGNFHLNNPASVLAALLVALALTGCGNKGSLVLPADPEVKAPEETTQDAATDQTEPKETP
ncbi:MAG: lipoprotein [Chromatiales bacterium]|nr:lipoprotein [Chromatiales bacterium]